jgi:UDP-N-acetylmuramoyl-tripeptide--D-alanyl-D-alanine ligase
VLAAADPLAALQRLATAWRRELDAAVIGVTGSVGKTSTKQLIAALVAPQRRVAANPANFNTEIGLPLAVLAAPPGTEVLVLEMGMRGFGQIDELARIAEPDVGVITNVGPVHLELVGDLAGVARAKGELLAHVPVAIIPADAPLLDPYLREGLDVVRFGTDVMLEDFDPPRVTILARELRVELDVPFTARHQLVNLLAAVAAAQAVGVEPSGRVDVCFGALRGEHVNLPSGVVIINDCYNANPLSMRAALDDLAMQAPHGRRIAVLGDMLELGAGEAEAHREIGAYAAVSAVDVLVAVGPLSTFMLEAFGGEAHGVADARAAAALASELVRPGDVVLVKASRGIGLEAVAEALAHG